MKLKYILFIAPKDTLNYPLILLLLFLLLILQNGRSKGKNCEKSISHNMDDNDINNYSKDKKAYIIAKKLG